MSAGVSAPMGLGFLYDAGPAEPTDPIERKSATPSQSQPLPSSPRSAAKKDMAKRDKKDKTPKKEKTSKKHKPPKEKVGKEGSKDKRKDKGDSLDTRKGGLRRFLPFGKAKNATTSMPALISSAPDLIQRPPSSQSFAGSEGIPSVGGHCLEDEEDPFSATLTPEVKNIHMSVLAMMEETTIFARDQPKRPSHSTSPLPRISSFGRDESASASASASSSSSSSNADDDDDLNIDDDDITASELNPREPSPSALLRGSEDSPRAQLRGDESISSEASVDDFQATAIPNSAMGLFATLAPSSSSPASLRSNSSPSTPPSASSPSHASASASVSNIAAISTSASLSSSSSVSNLASRPSISLPRLKRTNTARLVQPNPADTPPPDLPSNLMDCVAGRNEIREAFSSNPSREATLGYQQLFTGPDSDDNTLRKTTAGTGGHCDFEGLTLEKLMFRVTTGSEPSAFMCFKNAQSPPYGNLAAALGNLSLMDMAMSSYRSAMSPQELFDMLQVMWELPPCRQGLHDFLVLWVSVFGYDFYSRPDLLRDIYNFILHTFIKDPQLSNSLQLIQLVAEAMRGDLPPVAPIPERSNSTISSWSTLTPKQLAEGITYHDFRIFSIIQTNELLVWPYLTKEEKQTQAPNISAMVSQFNYWHYFTTTHVLKYREPSQRAKALMSAVGLALSLKKLNNISGLTAVISALSSTPVSRLRASWTLLPGKYHKVYLTLSKFISSQSNFGAIRRHLLEQPLPGIPHIGVLMQDITFIRENSDFLPFRSEPTDLFNCKKGTLTAKTVATLLYFQKSVFKRSGTISPEALELLRINPVLRADVLPKLSEKLEPRSSMS
ncbi:MAG: guanine nucleotide exchange factor [archaeon]|nr:guanine nucleotide exchange factor [archaeon]